MDNVILQLPREGELVTVPLLTAAGLTFGALSLGTATAATTTITMSSAAITYADLRILGFVGQHLSAATSALSYTWELNSANVNGDIQLLYGPAPGQVISATTTQGFGKLFVPGLRDNSFVEKNTRIRAVLTSRKAAAGAKAITIGCQIAAICERVRDPKATRVD
jgi:hypothetical protein